MRVFGGGIARIEPEERAQEGLSSDRSLRSGPDPQPVHPVAGGNATAASDPAPALEAEHESEGVGGDVAAESTKNGIAPHGWQSQSTDEWPT